ncbi:MAG: WD40/YVTN/BNR-like repeat-containing protein [Candidatus Omnitrophota bacterium]
MKKIFVSIAKVFLFLAIITPLGFAHLPCSRCGVNWNSVSVSEPSVLWDVAFCNFSCLFVAVGENGVIKTSPDGINWTNRTSNTKNKLVGLRHEKQYCGPMVAVGYNGTILYSWHGINWDSDYSGTTERLRGVAYYANDNTYVAVGDNGTILRSFLDLGNWEKVCSGTTQRLLDVCYSYSAGKKFVAVGLVGTILTSDCQAKSWTKRASGTTVTLNSVTGGPLIVAVGDEGKILTSSNGMTWTSRASGVIEDLFAVSYSNGMYVIAGVKGQSIIALKSTDGINWSKTTMSTKEQIWGLSYGNSRFVGVGHHVSTYSLCN